MLPDIFFCMYGRFTDPTIITGIPAWNKPLKFALSTGVYTGCLAVLVRHTRTWPAIVRICEHLAGLALFLEIVIIDLQAARHTTSHFNVATPLDTSLWTTMGVSILVLWLASSVLTAATFQTVYRTGLRTTAIRWGMVIAILGMATGAFMAVPSKAQKDTVATTHHLGSHTIGGTDGGPGLPFLSWSTQHGDVRPAHFIGMHALQVLLLVALLIERLPVPAETADRLMKAATRSYAALFLLILVEALCAEPLTDHSAFVLGVWLAWFVASLSMFESAARESERQSQLNDLGATA
jgi:hypothetical protein